MAKKQKMLTLYEFLGYGAGELGKEVYQAAKSIGIPLERKKIESKGFTGEVMCYPENFLKEYFEMKQKQAMKKLADEQEDTTFDSEEFDPNDLPF
jgi:hypothetical protein